jgi:hypothetical protein
VVTICDDFEGKCGTIQDKDTIQNVTLAHPQRPDIRTIQDLGGHADLGTTMVNKYAMSKNRYDVVSPLDRYCLKIISIRYYGAASQ